MCDSDTNCPVEVLNDMTTRNLRDFGAFAAQRLFCESVFYVIIDLKNHKMDKRTQQLQSAYSHFSCDFTVPSKRRQCLVPHTNKLPKRNVVYFVICVLICALFSPSSSGCTCAVFSRNSWTDQHFCGNQQQGYHFCER